MEKQYLIHVTSAQEMVYRTLRDQIINMELKPGSVISTQEIALSLNVSRTPVREAFLQLQSENLLEISPQRSTVVAKIDINRVMQERFIREALEVECLKRFIPMADSKTVSKMRENVELQKLAIKEQRYVDYIELDNKFHSIGYEIASETLCCSIVKKMNGHYDRMRLVSTWEGPLVENAIYEHSKMVDYIEQKDVISCEKLLRTHLQGLDVHSKRLMKNWSDCFTEKSLKQLE